MSGVAKKTGKLQRMLGEKPVKAVLYCGKYAGHGKYMAGEVDNELVCDENKKPLPLRSIGEIKFI